MVLVRLVAKLDKSGTHKPCAIHMKRVHEISDRAKRYRANRTHKLGKRCECTNRSHGHGSLCGSGESLGVGHRDGNESNGRKSNLLTICKSCNAKQAISDKKAGRGVRTRQYNPDTSLIRHQRYFLRSRWRGIPDRMIPVEYADDASKVFSAIRDAHGFGASDLKPGSGDILDQDGKIIGRISYNGRIWKKNPAMAYGARPNPGATNLAQYVQAAVEHSRGAHDAGGRIIHETPKAKRKEFAREIAWRKGYRNPRGRAEGELEVEDKSPHTEVDYEPHSKHLPDRCGNCANVIKANPFRCLTVKNPISSVAWCERYTQISNAQNPSDRVYREWKSGKLRTSAGVLVPRGTRGEKQARAILLSELRREGKIPARMNPGDTDADELYKLFHGRGPDESYSVDVPMIDAYAQHPDLTQLGFLTRLIVGEGVIKMRKDEVIEAEDDSWHEELDFVQGFKQWERFAASFPDDLSQQDINAMKQYLREHHAPDVAAAPPARQLFIVGGNQNLDRILEKLGCDPTKDVLDLGFCYMIEYFTQKRFDAFDPTSYYHHFGERSGVQPRVTYYKGVHQLQLAGGEYLVTRRGIEN